MIGTVVDGSAQSIAESMRIGGVTRSRLDMPGVSKRQRGEPACTWGGGKLGETRTELVVRFWPLSAHREGLKTTDCVEKVGLPKTLEY